MRYLEVMEIINTIHHFATPNIVVSEVCSPTIKFVMIETRYNICPVLVDQKLAMLHFVNELAAKKSVHVVLHNCVPNLGLFNPPPHLLSVT